MTDLLGAWEPMPLDDVSLLLRDVGCPWWVAGGWAIDLHVGRVTRKHEDTDVFILRDDQLRVQRHLDGWDMFAADPPGTLRRWLPGEPLPVGVHDIWCRRSPDEPWSLQLMLNDAEAGEWVYRRDTQIRRPVDDLKGPSSTVELPVLAPQIQLLYKSKSPRPKDDADLRHCLDALSAEQGTWLEQSLAMCSPESPWLRIVRERFGTGA